MQALIDQALMQALMQDNRAILIALTPRIGESALKMSYCNHPPPIGQTSTILDRWGRSRI
jgi:hypothetical protein